MCYESTSPFLGGFIAFYIIFNSILSICRIKIDYDRGSKSSRHKVAACATIFLLCYSVSYIYAAINLDELYFNKGTAYAMAMSSVFSGAFLSLFSSLKHVAVVASVVKRQRIIVFVVSIIVIAMAVMIYTAVTDIQKAETLPPKYSIAFSLCIMLCIFFAVFLGGGLFSYHIWQQVQKLPQTRRAFILLLTSVNIFNFLSILCWIVVVIATMKLTGTIYTTPSTIICMNTILFFENFGDLLTREVASRERNKSAAKNSKDMTGAIKSGAALKS
ncbi:hypothetical protein ROZALSC1DRAFT_20348 [Rozella allomycis CSF55]|uniref:Uncharacterized protein n=1 Tax=Rozella allomycis (strain CSF55) TaxID=988480 RepID=A0A4P9YQ11_ROZAC|nr:hypothetical protein ROZALSC1DRAFT_20348 [Rozella allomycis CSF55]